MKGVFFMKYKWKYCSKCGNVFSIVYPQDNKRCPYCGSTETLEISPDKIVYVEIGVKEPEPMVIQRLTTEDMASTLLASIPEEIIKGKKTLYLKDMEYKDVSRAYTFAYKNAVATRDPKLWHLVEDVKRFSTETASKPLLVRKKK